MNKKGFAHPAVIVAIVLGIALLLYFSPIGSALGLKAPKNCNEDGYNELCYCDQGQRRIFVPWVGMDKWHCENLELLLIDPESETFEEDSLAFIQNYLYYYCDSVCDVIECGDFCAGGTPQGGADRCMNAVWGYGSTGSRAVNIECMVITEWENGLPSTGYIPWRMEFLVESETDTPVAYEVYAASNYCVDSAATKRCAPPEYCDATGGENCFGQLPINFIPTPVTMSLGGGLGSDWEAPVK